MTIGDALPYVAFWFSGAAVVITYLVLVYKASKHGDRN